MVKIKTLVSWDTHFSADSVEWCPVENLQHLFVCGTYQLTQDKNQTKAEESYVVNSRLGKLHLMSLLDSEEVVEKLQTMEMPAVLDCKWASQRIHDKVLLAVANAIGQLCIYKLTQDEVSAKPQLQKETEADLPRDACETDLLTLSLDWSIEADKPRLATSNSRGRISVFRLDQTGLQIEQNWSAHEFEAWVVLFDPFDPQTCYTGGDDSKLQVYDLRCDPVSSKMTNSIHRAGVTSLSCPRNTEHLLLSGSYDERVLQWDTRQMRRPVKDTCLDGGVWRLKWRPHSEDLILSASMYDGFHVLSQSLDIVAEQKTVHESIVYGADWSYLHSSSDKHYSLLSEESSIIATCSFYDHKLCIHLVTDE